VTEAFAVNKPRRQARPLSDLTASVLADSFARQGFASAELVTRWPQIAGPEISAHCEPVKIQWPRASDPDDREPGTLVLRVEGPAAIEIQHLSGVILERVNRFFGWHAVGRLALRQAPLSRRGKAPPALPDAAKAARIAATLPAIEDEGLKQALARLGAAIKRT
jgi:hypothetical protein